VKKVLDKSEIIKEKERRGLYGTGLMGKMMGGIMGGLGIDVNEIETPAEEEDPNVDPLNQEEDRSTNSSGEDDALGGLGLGKSELNKKMSLAELNKQIDEKEKKRKTQIAEGRSTAATDEELSELKLLREVQRTVGSKKSKTGGEESFLEKLRNSPKNKEGNVIGAEEKEATGATAKGDMTARTDRSSATVGNRSRASRGSNSTSPTRRSSNPILSRRKSTHDFDPDFDHISPPRKQTEDFRNKIYEQSKQPCGIMSDRIKNHVDKHANRLSRDDTRRSMVKLTETSEPHFTKTRTSWERQRDRPDTWGNDDHHSPFDEHGEGLFNIRIKVTLRSDSVNHWIFFEHSNFEFNFLNNYFPLTWYKTQSVEIIVRRLSKFKQTKNLNPRQPPV
jgi:hypothetical protein